MAEKRMKDVVTFHYSAWALTLTPGDKVTSNDIGRETWCLGQFHINMELEANIMLGTIKESGTKRAFICTPILLCHAYS